MNTLIDVAVADGHFKTLATALTAAGLIDTLKGAGPFTVFAPTDDAFAKLPAGTLDGLLKDIPKLTAILKYHVLAGKFAAADLETRLAARDVPCARMVTLAEFLKRATAGGMLTLPLRSTAYAHGTLTDFGAGFKADGSDGPALAAAPRLGQHTAAILAEVGFSATEIAALVKEGRAKV